MPTYTPIQSIQLSSASDSVTFSNIPQIYQDLRLVYNGTMSANQQVIIRFNASSISWYSFTRLTGNGSSASSDRSSNTSSIPISSGNVSNLSLSTVDIFGYSNTSVFKTIVSRWANPTDGTSSLVSGLWRGSDGASTEAINSITISTSTADTFGVGSKFDLYGISTSDAIVAKASGGTDIYYDSTHVYHVFKGSGVFTPSINLAADILVVAGGGAGGADGGRGGGGGAGGLRYAAGVSYNANTSYSCIIGAGGSRGSIGPDYVASSGNNSSLGPVSAAGGGRGGTGPLGANPNGASGGSGGGAISYYSGSAGAGNTPSTVPSQGNNGGSNGGLNVYGAGGGGGAGGVGQNGSGNNGGNGGIGFSNAVVNAMGLATSTGILSGGNYYFAGGGAGGSTTNDTFGGLGGGGNWVNSTATPSSGIQNTGGGGAGGGSYSGFGGSGIVIVRYPR